MITSVTAKGKYAARVGAKESKTFYFKEGINLLVGPNGSGKSTLLHGLMDLSKKKVGINENIEAKASAPIRINYFDFEKMNIRTKGHFEQSSGPMMFQVTSMFKSHGETNRFLAEGMLGSEDHVKDSVVLLDEPDQAMDHNGAVDLLGWMRSSTAKQLIVAVHHPLLVLQKDVNIVEMRDGYRKEMMEMFRSLLGE